MKKDKYYSFIFRGLLTEEALDKTGRPSKILFSEEEENNIAKKLCIELLDEDFIKRSKKMAIVYTAITAFENSVRKFITKKLLEQVGANWWTTSVSTEIQKKVTQKMEKEEKYKFHSARGGDLIDYTNFNNLTNIIGRNYSYFEPHFISIEWARTLLISLENSRNVIMHGGELSIEDIERIGINIRDWTNQIGG